MAAVVPFLLPALLLLFGAVFFCPILGQTDILCDVCDCTNVPFVNCSNRSLIYFPRPPPIASNLKISSIDFSFNPVVNLSGAFQGYENLTSLDLSNCGLTSDLPPLTFQLLTKLTSLSLKDNLFDALRIGLFEGLDSLEYLDLSNNMILLIQTGVGDSLLSLQALNLSSNSLFSIGRALTTVNLPLKVLDLSKNSIQAIAEDAFATVPHLLHLNMSGNLLFSLTPKDLSIGLESLLTLDLSDNPLTDIGNGSLHNLPSLVHLSFRGCPIPFLRADFFAPLPSLRSLDVSRMNCLGSSFIGQYFPSIQKMDLSHNLFVSLPPGYFKYLGNLTSLDLSNNQITSVFTYAFSGLNSIQFLSLAHNKLSLIWDGMFDFLAPLFELDLSSNRITSIQANSFLVLKNVRSLKISNNFLADPMLESLHLKLPSLQELDISSNLISFFVVEAFRNLSSSLRILDLSSNQIHSLNFSSSIPFSSLKTLDLSNNNISAPFFSFAWAPSISFLNLSFCNMTVFPLISSSALTTLDLSFNHITSVPQNAFLEAPQLLMLNISNNMISNASRQALMKTNLTSIMTNNPYQCVHACVPANGSACDVSNLECGAVCLSPPISGSFDVACEPTKVPFSSLCHISCPLGFINVNNATNGLQCQSGVWAITNRTLPVCEARPNSSLLTTISTTTAKMTTTTTVSSHSSSASSSGSSSSALLIALVAGIVGLLVIVLLVLVSLAYLRRKRAAAHRASSADRSAHVVQDDSTVSSPLFCACCRPTRVSIMDMELQRLAVLHARSQKLLTQIFPDMRFRSGSSSDGGRDGSDELDEAPAEFKLSQLSMDRELGQGAGGVVMLGHLKPHGRTSRPVACAIKQLRPGSTFEDEIKLLCEARLLLALRHPHIIRLIGVCTDVTPLLMILEFMPHGNLRDYLRAKKAQDITHTGDVAVGVLVGYLTQVASAMEFLESHHVIHRDLAARNVLVGEANKVKLSDFGLSRWTNTSDYYRQVSEDRIPFKWLPLEAIEDKTFTSKSDVWSFGVMGWEVLTLGGTPYSVMSVPEVVKYVRQGKRLERPRGCPEEVYAVLQGCWALDPEQRPPFKTLHSTLIGLLAQGSQEANKRLSMVVPLSSLSTELIGPPHLLHPLQGGVVGRGGFHGNPKVLYLQGHTGGGNTDAHEEDEEDEEETAHL